MELNACIATATHQPEGSGLATALGVCPKSGEKLTLLGKWALTAVSRFSFRADGAVGDQGIDDVVPDDLENHLVSPCHRTSFSPCIILSM